MRVAIIENESRSVIRFGRSLVKARSLSEQVRTAHRVRHRRAGWLAVSELALIGLVLAIAYFGARQAVSLSSSSIEESAATARACSDRPVCRLWMDSTGNLLWAFRRTADVTGYCVQTGEVAQARDFVVPGVSLMAQSRDGAVSLQLTHNNALHLDAAGSDPVWMDHYNDNLHIAELIVSDQGTLALVAHSNGTVAGWSIADKHVEPLNYRLLDKRLARACLDGAGTTLCGAFKDGTVSFHDARTGQQLPGSLKLDGECTAISWSRDGQRLALATRGGTVSLFDVATRRCIWIADIKRYPELICMTSVALSADGRWLAATGLCEDFFVWDLTSSDGARRLSGHQGLARTVAFSPTTVFSGGLDGTIREGSLKTFTTIKTLN